MRPSGDAFRVAVALKCIAIAAFCSADTSITVQSRPKPSDTWRDYPTRTIAQLPGFPAGAKPPELDQYGGLKSGKSRATGFFRTEKIGERWWLIDPDGGRFLHMGVASVRPEPSEKSGRAFSGKFTGEQDWADSTARMLRDHGFNGVGAWCNDSICSGGLRIAYTKIWSFMASYGRKRGGTYSRPGNTGYPNQCIFVFDPDFETFCDSHAKQLSALRNDPWLLGHFTDNEMPLDSDVLDRYLALPDGDHGKEAAATWMRKHRPGWNGVVSADEATSPTDAERNAFLEHVVDRYFGIVTRAIRKHDPNHLILGSRFNGRALRTPEVFRAAGRHIDVMSVNYYNAWTPKAERLDMWVKESGKPCIISEFYIKGEDSGLPNQSGAGWIVRTQAERGAFYQNYALGLLDLKSCVGWHWFRYADNDPNGALAGGKPQDSNKGIVTSTYEPYAPLLRSMRELNINAYGLADYLDSKSDK